MTNSFKKEDLRIVKTYKSLLVAIQALLQKRNFGQITVNDLCEEALVSRATFYAHFYDKYDLLRHWLSVLRQDIAQNMVMGAEEEVIVRALQENQQIIKNIVDGANNEVLDLIHNFMFSLVEDVFIKEKISGPLSAHMFVLAHFCAASMVHALGWYVKNYYPYENVTVAYFIDIIKSVVNWGVEQEYDGTDE